MALARLSTRSSVRFAQTLGLFILLALAPISAAPVTGISGLVVNETTGMPVSGVRVDVYDSTGTFAGQATTGSTGTYQVTGLTAGTYYAHTSNALGLLDEIYAGGQCPVSGCSGTGALGGTPIVVTFGHTTSGRDFTLRPGGSISGTIRGADTSAGLSRYVFLFTQVNGEAVSVDETVSAASGSYTFTGLPSGTYHVATGDFSATSAYVDEWFSNIPCWGNCDIRDALASTPITVTEGNTTSGRDFVLDVGGLVAGRVTDAATSAGVQGVSVYAYAFGPRSIANAGSAVTDASGAYVIRGLAAGTYGVETSNAAGYIDETFDNILCPVRCGSIQSGRQVGVHLGATSDVNVALDVGGTITGTVRDAQTSVPLGNVYVMAYARFGENVVSVTATSAAGTGVFTLRGLPTGAYYLVTKNYTDYVDELYGTGICAPCSDDVVVESGTPTFVTAGGTVAGRDFALDKGGSISGTVTRADTHTPLSSTGVYAVTRVAGTPTYVKSAATDGNGLYTLKGLAAGTYYIYTFSQAGLVDEVYGGVPCPAQCRSDFTANHGTGIVVTAGAPVTGRNLELATAGRITGAVTDAATSAPMVDIDMDLFAVIDGVPTSIGGTSTNEIGRYTFDKLPAATYYVASSTRVALGYVNEAYANVACPASTGCTAAFMVGSTPIAVAAGATTGNRDFVLSPRREAPAAPTYLQARVSNFEVQFEWAPGVGALATGYIVEAGLTPGTTVATFPVGATSLTVPNAPPGRYFVRVRGVNTFGVGPASPDIELVIAGNGSAMPDAPDYATGFMSGSRLTMQWEPATSGGLPVGYLVEAGTATGIANVASLPVNGLSFSFDPVPPGYYFLRVRAYNALGLGPASNEMMINVGGVPSPPAAPLFYEPDVNGSTVSLSWKPRGAAPVTKYVLEAGTAEGLSNILVYDTGSAATTISFAGVPPGTYYVRVRAANGLGLGVPSYDEIVTVP